MTKESNELSMYWYVYLKHQSKKQGWNGLETHGFSVNAPATIFLLTLRPCKRKLSNAFSKSSVNMQLAKILHTSVK